MAAKSWNPFSCCVGGARVADNDDHCKRRIGRRGKGYPRSSSRMSFKSFSSSGTLSPEDLSITLSGSNLHAFTYAELRAATAGFSRSRYSAAAASGPCIRASSPPSSGRAWRRRRSPSSTSTSTPARRAITSGW